ncbi:hypothetical protein Tco_0623409, partial [Tanacetum coccineum]
SQETRCLRLCLPFAVIVINLSIRVNNMCHVGSIRVSAATWVPPSVAHQCATVTLADQRAVTLADQDAVTSTSFGVHEAVVFNEKLLSQNTLANEALRLGNEAPRLDVKLVSQNDYVGKALGLDGKLLSQSNSANVTPELNSKILFQIIL